MSNSADAARKTAEPSAHQAVRRVLDTVKAEKRTSLTAPEGKGCATLRHPGSPRSVGEVRRRGGQARNGHGLPGGDEIVSPETLKTTEAGGVVVGVKPRLTRKRPTRPPRHARSIRLTPRSRASGPSDAGRRPRGSSSAQLPTARSASWWRSASAASGRDSQGHHFPPGARHQGRRPVDARWHPAHDM